MLQLAENGDVTNVGNILDPTKDVAMLVFYYQVTDKFKVVSKKQEGAPRLFLANPAKDKLTGMCIYCYKTSTKVSDRAPQRRTLNLCNKTCNNLYRAHPVPLNNVNNPWHLMHLSPSLGTPRNRFVLQIRCRKLRRVTLQQKPSTLPSILVKTRKKVNFLLLCPTSSQQ